MARIIRSHLGAAALTAAAALLSLLLLARAHGAATPRYWTERDSRQPGPTTMVPDWAEIARTTKPAVVNISVRKGAEGLLGGALPGRSPRAGTGSGFIISADGYVLTNNHVVDGASSVRVKLADGRQLDARVAGRDPQTDLAVLKLDAAGLPTVPLGDSSTLRVGEPVMAVGNPFGLEQTVTTGIVSATGRVIGEGPYDDFIQTDASINPGNSGGPLINARGEVIGINTAIVSNGGGSIGIGFAVPVSLARFVVPQLAQHGRVERGWLGVTMQPLTPELAAGLKLPQTQGALVSEVAKGSPAATAGFRPGDVIVEFDGRPITRTTDLSLLVAASPVGQSVKLAVLRDGRPLTLEARIAKRAAPVDVAAAPPAEPERRGRLGVVVEPVTPEMATQLDLLGSGVLVRQVVPGSPAAQAGMRPGDVISEVDRQPVKNVDDLRRAVEHLAPGSSALVLVHRRGGSAYLAVRV